MGTLLGKPLEVLETNLRMPAGPAGRLVGHLMAVRHRALTEWAIDHMRVGRYQRVLDVGCGGGMAAALLARRAERGFVAGVDWSLEMVRQAIRRNATAIARGRAEFRHGDCAALPYPDESFDQVCAIETFYFWPDPMRGLAEAHRVLRPGGQVSITLEMSREAAPDPSLAQRFLGRRFVERSEREGLRIPSAADLAGMLAEAGFRDVRHAAEPSRAMGWLCVLARRA